MSDRDWSAWAPRVCPVCRKEFEPCLTTRSKHQAAAQVHCSVSCGALARMRKRQDDLDNTPPF